MADDPCKRRNKRRCPRGRRLIFKIELQQKVQPPIRRLFIVLQYILPYVLRVGVCAELGIDILGIDKIHAITRFLRNV